MNTLASEKMDREASKTQRKRDMQALQMLGEALVDLPRERLAKITLPEVLRQAVLDAIRINQRGARRRQIQYIGKLMRDVDASAIREQVRATHSGSAQEAAVLHRAERWRERLLSDDSSLSEFVTKYPGSDVQKLRSLLRNAKIETAANKPPRNSRALYREIRELISRPV